MSPPARSRPRRQSSRRDKRRHENGIELLDMAGNPVVGERYWILLPRRDDARGAAATAPDAPTSRNLDPGECDIRFPISTRTLPASPRPPCGPSGRAARRRHQNQESGARWATRRPPHSKRALPHRAAGRLQGRGAAGRARAGPGPRHRWGIRRSRSQTSTPKRGRSSREHPAQGGWGRSASRASPSATGSPRTRSGRILKTWSCRRSAPTRTRCSPGDIVMIRKRTPETFTRRTGKRHTFQRRGVRRSSRCSSSRTGSRARTSPSS